MSLTQVKDAGVQDNSTRYSNTEDKMHLMHQNGCLWDCKQWGIEIKGNRGMDDGWMVE